ncbi:MAG: ABC transporter ATP-binding protein [Tetrasphaera sp.]
MTKRDNVKRDDVRDPARRVEHLRGLAAEHVVVRYGSATAVDDVTLHVAPGEIVALLGASGSGKSSLLRGIAGLEPLVGGEIRWDDEWLTDVAVHRRGFGVMFQEGQLFPHRDVGGNVAYGIHDLPRGQRRRRVGELLDVVGLGGFEDRAVTSLSGGQAQRVALARSLAPAPRLLLLDEPLSALDRALREHLVGVLRSSLRATETTAIYVTHDQDEAFAVADRVAVMAAGRLARIDAPAALWSAPGTREVAAFLGYGPFLSSEQAQALGWVDPRPPGGPSSGDETSPTGRPSDSRPCQLAGADPIELVGVGPGALVLDPAGTAVPVESATARRGHTELTVRLPGGTPAVVRAPLGSGIPLEVQVRLDADATVVVR